MLLDVPNLLSPEKKDEQKTLLKETSDTIAFFSCRGSIIQCMTKGSNEFQREGKGGKDRT